jgi:dihydroorotase
MNIAIIGARVLDPVARLDEVTDVYISDGTISHVGNEEPLGWREQERIEARGLWLMPGIVDLAARLREPGQSHKATIASEMQAASTAGITSVCIPPDTDPVIDTPAVVEWIRQRSGATAPVHIHVLGALTQKLGGEVISAMAALKDAGCVGVSNARRAIGNSLLLRRAMEYAATFDLTVHLCPQDHWLKNGGCAHEGPVATRLGLAGIPEAAETVAVARDLALIEQTGAQAHFCRLSTRRAVEMIAEAQARGLAVTADVSAHQLFLTDNDLLGFNSLCHVDPPLRSTMDRDALRDAVRSGVVGAVCSDHQPHEPDAKTNPFPATEPGISAFETLLPLVMKLVDDDELDLLDAVHRLTAGPAQVLGLETGQLRAGAAADLCLVDPERKWTFETGAMRSAGKNSPFGGWEFKGQVAATVVNGAIVYRAQ